MAEKPKEDYDRDAVNTAFEKGLPHAVKVAGAVGDRFAADMEKKFGPTPTIVRGPRGEPIVPSSNIPKEFDDESMCSN